MSIGETCTFEERYDGKGLNIDDVLPEEEQLYKEVTDVMVNLDFLDENLKFAG